MAPHYLPILFLLPLFIVLQSPLGASQTSPQISLPGCRDKCGSITVPYPFGLEPNCFREGFKLVCNESYSPPRLFINGSLGYEVTDISPRGELHISVTAKRACNSSTGGFVSDTRASTTMKINLVSSPYLLSVNNSFFVVGCPTQGYFIDEVGYYVKGCVSVCRPTQYTLGGYKGPCNITGYCESSIPYALGFYKPYLQKFEGAANDTDPMLIGNISTCSYAFLADSNWFSFDNSYLSRTDDFVVPVRIDWAVRDVGNCSYARRNMTDYACRSLNHDCYDSHNGVGYLCNCSQGYQGNPYITGGCQGIIISSELLLLYNQIEMVAAPLLSS
jgi:Wall-associated receptor kinase galacturonan-binding